LLKDTKTSVQQIAVITQCCSIYISKLIFASHVVGVRSIRPTAKSACHTSVCLCVCLSRSAPIRQKLHAHSSRNFL